MKGGARTVTVGGDALRPLLAPTWIDVRRAAGDRDPRVLSLDVFETLLLRDVAGGRLVREAVAHEAVRVARARAHHDLGSPTLHRRAAERLVRQDLLARGLDPESSHREVLRALLRAAADAEPDEAVVDALCALEVDIERRTTEVAEPVAALVRAAAAAGVRVVAVSDMYLSGEEIGVLLKAHGITQVSHVWSSSDVGASKFTGRLFAHLLRTEGVLPDEVVHVGDNLLADVLSPRAHGIRAMWTTPGRATVRSSAGQHAGGAASHDPRFALGYEVLGPALVTYAHLALQRAARDGVDELAFVARDGDLPMQVMERVIDDAPLLDKPSLRYVHLSRRSTLLAGAGALRSEEIGDLLAARATNAGLKTLLSGLALDPGPLQPLLARHTDLPIDRPIVRPERDPVLQAIVADPDVVREVARQAEVQRDRLRRYLDAEGFFRSGHRVALADVGWRGTIQSSLKSAFGSDPSFALRHGYYLGMWADAVTGDPTDLQDKWGALGDYRRGRSLHEAAPWQLAFLFESVCRAPHGTVLGFRDDGDRVTPVHATPETSASRRTELLDEEAREPIRQGVLAFAESRAARRIALLAVNAQRARQVVQRRMLRTAFYPTQAELRAVAMLHHTEGAAEQWSTALVGPVQLRPWREPRAWAAGLSAPWRSGYVAATGGAGLSTLYALAEAARMRLPATATRAVRERVLGWLDR